MKNMIIRGKNYTNKQIRIYNAIKTYFYDGEISDSNKVRLMI